MSRGEASGTHRLDHEHPERSARPALDLHRQARARPPSAEVRLLEAALGVPVLDHHRRSAQQRVSRLRARAGRVAQLSGLGVGPPDSAPEDERALLGKPFPHRRDLGSQHLSGAVDGFAHQVGGGRTLERVLAEQRDRRLLGSAPLELRLDPHAGRDVGEHPVPAAARRPRSGRARHRREPTPRVRRDGSSGTRAAHRRGSCSRSRTRARSPTRGSSVQVLGPQLRRRAPFGRGVAEDLLDVRADVVPAPDLAGVGDVDDGGHAFEQLRVFRSRDATGPRVDRGRWASCRCRCRRPCSLLIGIPGASNSVAGRVLSAGLPGGGVTASSRATALNDLRRATSPERVHAGRDRSPTSIFNWYEAAHAPFGCCMAPNASGNLHAHSW